MLLVDRTYNSLKTLKPIIGCLLLPLIAQLISTSVQAQCSPTLREIFDFEVGDEFFYCVSSSDGFERRSGRVHQRKRVLSIEWVENTLTIEFGISSAPVASRPFSCDTIGTFGSQETKSTFTIIDSPQHCLNSCPDDTIPAPWGLSFVVPNNYTVVTNGWDGDPDVKAFGQHGYWLLTAADTFAYDGNLGYHSSWQAKRGLGIISESWRDGYLTGGSTLIGWIKNGEVSGFVPTYARSSLDATDRTAILHDSYPLRLNEVPGTISRVQVFSMSGQRCFDRSGAIGTEIWLDHLTVGAYVALVTTETSTYRYRIVKPGIRQGR